MIMAEQRKFWEEFYKDSLNSAGTRYAYQLFSQKSGKVLEVGCGDLCYNGIDGDYYVGIDISHNALKKAKEALTYIKRPASVVVASATHLPFKDNSFDLVTSIETITLLGSDFYTALQEMKRVSKDKLVFTLSHIDIAKAHNPDKEFIKKEDHFLIKHSPSGEKAFFTKENIESVLKKLELKIETLEVLTEYDVIYLGVGSPVCSFDCEFPNVNSRIFVDARK